MPANQGNSITLAPEHFFDGQQLHKNTHITISNQLITKIHYKQNTPPDDRHVRPLKGILCSGLIDLQVNGGGGVLFNHAPNYESLKIISEAHRRAGTSYLLPTVITDSVDIMSRAADAIATAIKDQLPGVIGVHFEGPHISSPKRGVHPKQHIRTLSESEKAIFSRTDIGLKLITVAPEAITAEDISWLKRQGCVVSIGHTNAPFEQHLVAMAAGATGFTHLYNAMSPLMSREPGAVGAALYNEDAFAGIILDGHHCDYVAAKLAWRLKNENESLGNGRLYLVSDAMATAASQVTEFSLFGEAITASAGRLTTKEGTLAGAHLTLLEAVQNAVSELDLPIAEALKMATSYPMSFLLNSLEIDSPFVDETIRKIARLQIGSTADLILLDEKLNLVERLSHS